MADVNQEEPQADRPSPGLQAEPREPVQAPGVPQQPAEAPPDPEVPIKPAEASSDATAIEEAFSGPTQTVTASASPGVVVEPLPGMEAPPDPNRSLSPSPGPEPVEIPDDPGPAPAIGDPAAAPSKERMNHAMAFMQRQRALREEGKSRHKEAPEAPPDPGNSDFAVASDAELMNNPTAGMADASAPADHKADTSMAWEGQRVKGKPGLEQFTSTAPAAPEDPKSKIPDAPADPKGGEDAVASALKEILGEMQKQTGILQQILEKDQGAHAS